MFLVNIVFSLCIGVYCVCVSALYFQKRHHHHCRFWKNPLNPEITPLFLKKPPVFWVNFFGSPSTDPHFYCSKRSHFFLFLVVFVLTYVCVYVCICVEITIVIVVNQRIYVCMCVYQWFRVLFVFFDVYPPIRVCMGDFVRFSFLEKGLFSWKRAVFRDFRLFSSFFLVKSAPDGSRW